MTTQSPLPPETERATPAVNDVPRAKPHISRTIAGIAGVLLAVAAVTYIAWARESHTMIEPTANMATPVLATPPTPPSGDRVYDGWKLTRQDGQPFDGTALRGQTVIMNMAFTACSTTCPTTTAQLVELNRRLAAAGQEHVALVTVSADPLHDDPKTLLAYAQARGANAANWHWLTGAVKDVAQAQEDLMGEGARNRPADAHLTKLVLINPWGKRIGSFDGIDLDYERIIREIAKSESLFGKPAREAQAALPATL